MASFLAVLTKSITSSTLDPLYKERLMVTNKLLANLDFSLNYTSSSIGVILLDLLILTASEKAKRHTKNIAIEVCFMIECYVCFLIKNIILFFKNVYEYGFYS